MTPQQNRTKQIVSRRTIPLNRGEQSAELPVTDAGLVDRFLAGLRRAVAWGVVCGFWFAVGVLVGARL